MYTCNFAKLSLTKNRPLTEMTHLQLNTVLHMDLFQHQHNINARHIINIRTCNEYCLFSNKPRQSNTPPYYDKDTFTHLLENTNYNVIVENIIVNKQIPLLQYCHTLYQHNNKYLRTHHNY